MSSTQAWFEKQFKREKNFFSLMITFFQDKLLSYFLFRIKLYNVNVLIRIITYSTILFYVHQATVRSSFRELIFFSSLLFMARSFVWGALEVMRSKIRGERIAKNIIEIEDLIYHWLRLSYFVSAGLALLSVMITVLAHFQWGSFESNLLWAMTISIMISIPVSVYHSGVYALKRINRTLFSVVAADLTMFVIFLLLWPYVGVQCLPFLIVFRSILAALLTIYYIRRMYFIMEYVPDRAKRKQKVKYFHPLDMCVSGLAGVFLRSYGLIMLSYYFFAKTGLNSMLITFLVVYPLVIALFSFARLFYFDQKRLSMPEYISFFTLLSAMNTRFSRWIGCGYWLTAGVILLFIPLDGKWFSWLVFLPVFIFVPMIVLQQVKLFCSYYYFDVIASGLLLLSLLNFILTQPTLHSANILIAYALILLLFYFTQNPIFPIFKRFTYTQSINNRYHWMQSLYNLTEHTKVIKIKFSESSYEHLNSYIITWLNNDVIKRGGLVTQTSDFDYYIYLTGCASSIDLSNIVFMTANTIEDYKVMILDNPRSELGLALEQAFFSGLFTEKCYPLCHELLDVDSFYCEFFESFPAGFIYNPRLLLGYKRAAVSEYEATELFALIKLQLAQTHPEAHAKLGVCVLYINKSIHSVFVVKTEHLPRNKLQHWLSLKKKVEHYNVLGCINRLTVS